MKKLLNLVLCSLILLPVAFAQENDGDLVKKTQDDIMFIAAAGAAGGILGLSTLSFVDKPSQHLSNIWTGAALGVIAGVVFVAYQGAQRGSEELESSLEFNSFERVAWHQQQVENLTSKSVQFGSEFWSTSF